MSAFLPCILFYLTIFQDSSEETFRGTQRKDIWRSHVFQIIDPTVLIFTKLVMALQITPLLFYLLASSLLLFIFKISVVKKLDDHMPQNSQTTDVQSPSSRP